MYAVRIVGYERCTICTEPSLSGGRILWFLFIGLGMANIYTCSVFCTQTHMLPEFSLNLTDSFLFLHLFLSLAFTLLCFLPCVYLCSSCQ